MTGGDQSTTNLPGEVMGVQSFRVTLCAAPIACAAIFAEVMPAFAETSEISIADNAWMIVSTALVLMMIILMFALFYAVMVRNKNVIVTMAQSLASVMIIS